MLLKDILLIALPAIASGFGGWLFGRKRTKAEIEGIAANTESTQIDNAIKAVEMWRGIAQDMHKNYEKLKEDVNQLREELKKLHSENNRLRDRLRKLENENEKLHESLRSK